MINLKKNVRLRASIFYDRGNKFMYSTNIAQHFLYEFHIYDKIIVLKKLELRFKC